MKILILLFMFGSIRARAELTTVNHVDVNQYLGNWYQIAHIPLIFEGFGTCVCARQQLSAGANGAVAVYNSCNEGNAEGKLREIRGEAYSQDSVTNSKFSVDFHLPYRGSYWIIGLDPQYRFAVVSDSFSSSWFTFSLYILSKTPTLPPELYAQAVALAQAQQLNTDRLQVTDQSNCHYP